MGDWHRHAISQPQQLGVWWQGVFDQAGVRREEEVAWEEPREMPFAGQRLEVCAQGVRGEVAFPGLRAEAGVAAPARQGRRRVRRGVAAAGGLAEDGGRRRQRANQVYVFADGDWPLWQAAQRRDATARYAARTPAAAASNGTPLPAWPFALLFTLAMLALWWRERR